VINDSIYSSRSSMWETPWDLFRSLDREFHFQVDVCAIKENAKCPTFFSPEINGLKQDWTRFSSCFMNPPYGREISRWVRKAYEESKKGTTVVALLPARTDTRWFHNYIYKKEGVEIRFLKGRLKFMNRTLPSYRSDGKFRISNAPFPSMIVVFKNGEK